MSRFEVDPTSISGVRVISRKPIGDSRGFFERVFCVDDLSSIDFQLKQMNRSFTAERGSLRGMHFQYPPKAETKIVSCLRGSVFDVALDLRKDSPTFLQWHGEILSGENFRSMVIPHGVAHGFQTLEADCELLYLHDEVYDSELEGHVHLFEKRAGIDWPLDAGVLSDRDKNAPLLKDDFVGITL